MGYSTHYELEWKALTWEPVPLCPHKPPPDAKFCATCEGGSGSACLATDTRTNPRAHGRQVGPVFSVWPWRDRLATTLLDAGLLVWSRGGHAISDEGRAWLEALERRGGAT